MLPLCYCIHCSKSVFTCRLSHLDPDATIVHTLLAYLLVSYPMSTHGHVVHHYADPVVDHCREDKYV